LSKIHLEANFHSKIGAIIQKIDQIKLNLCQTYIEKFDEILISEALARAMLKEIIQE
jgi:sporulation-control protein spo0M